MELFSIKIRCTFQLVSTPLGAIGISFCGQKQMDASAVGKAIRKCGIQVATLLSN